MMATMHEKVTSFSKTSQPKENEYMEDEEEYVAEHGCACLWQLCFVRNRNNNGSYRYLTQQQQGEIKESWVESKVKKVKEMSEVLAGPKWKNFIRSFNTCGSDKKRTMQFHYDPQSYVLNFENGMDREGDGAQADFAARFAAPCRVKQSDTGL